MISDDRYKTTVSLKRVRKEISPSVVNFGNGCRATQLGKFVIRRQGMVMCRRRLMHNSVDTFLDQNS